MIDLENIVDKELEILIGRIKSNAYAAGKSVTGRTLAGLEVRSTKNKSELWAASYIHTLETGRGPARGGNSRGEFLNNLKIWIRAKGIPVKNDKDLERLAKFFKWYINKFGTYQYRHNIKYDIYSSELKKFEDKITDKLGNEIKVQILNML